MKDMEFDLTKPHCYYFNEIAKIPHGSKNEKRLSDWIVVLPKRTACAMYRTTCTTS